MSYNANSQALSDPAVDFKMIIKDLQAKQTAMLEQHH
jgi:hypothetical protein